MGVNGRRDDVSGAAGFGRAGWRTWPSLRRNPLPKVGAKAFIFVKLSKSFGLIMIRWWVGKVMHRLAAVDCPWSTFRAMTDVR